MGSNILNMSGFEIGPAFFRSPGSIRKGGVARFKTFVSQLNKIVQNLQEAIVSLDRRAESVSLGTDVNARLYFGISQETGDGQKGSPFGDLLQKAATIHHKKILLDICPVAWCCRSALSFLPLLQKSPVNEMLIWNCNILHITAQYITSLVNSPHQRS